MCFERSLRERTAPRYYSYAFRVMQPEGATMRKVQMFMFMTIDGQAQFPIYTEAPFTESDDDPMWKPRLGSIDTIILGGIAYLKWAAYWPKRKEDPNASEWQREFSRFADRAQKIVFSKTLQKPVWENTQIVRGTPAEEVARLRSKEGGNIALGGGPRIAQSFLADDLVDEMLIEIQPSIVGRGKPLFKTVDEPDFVEDVIPVGTPGRHDFLLREVKGLKDGTVFLRYELHRK